MSKIRRYRNKWQRSEHDESIDRDLLKKMKHLESRLLAVSQTIDKIYLPADAKKIYDKYPGLQEDRISECIGILHEKIGIVLTGDALKKDDMKWMNKINKILNTVG